MILMANGGFGFGLESSWPGAGIQGVEDLNIVDGGDGLTMDVDELYGILAESDDPSQSSPEDFAYQNFNVDSVEAATDVGNQKNIQLQSEFQRSDGAHASKFESIDTARFFPSHSPDARIGLSVTFFDKAGSSSSGMGFHDTKLEPSSQVGSPMQSYSGCFKDCSLPANRVQGEERVGVLQSEIPSCSTASSFAEGQLNHVPNLSGDLDTGTFLSETGTQFGHAGGNMDSKVASSGLYMDCLDGKFGHGDTLIENSLWSSGHKNDFCISPDMSVDDADVSLYNLDSTQSTFCHNLDVNTESTKNQSTAQFDMNSDSTYIDDPSAYYMGGGFEFEFFPSNGIGEFQSESRCSASEVSIIDHCDDKGLNFRSEGINGMSPMSRFFLSHADDRLVDNESLGMPFGSIQSAISKKQLVAIEKKAVEVGACRSMMCDSGEMTDEVVNRKLSYSDENSTFIEEDLKQSSSGLSYSLPSQKNLVYMEDEKGDMDFAITRPHIDGIAGKFPFGGVHFHSNDSEHYFSCAEESIVNKQPSCIKQERDGKLIQLKRSGHLSSISHESLQRNFSCSNSHADDDSDICILEDISQPARSHQFAAFGKTNAPLQHSANGDSIHYTGVGSTRPKANDERFIFHAALQDLSQPKSEASPPEGVLAVPLLRHQRIALSWMVQKETSSLYCSGGILADDQGLGKTVSTIALILKERPPSVKPDLQVVKKKEFETLNLDEDDDEVAEVGRIKEDADSCQRMSNWIPKKSTNNFEQSKGRPAAGTLVVCPTSVLRQWAEELHKKVTSKANLSVLVYHGSNRTKDPCEVAKYDVVLTTYSIVSMEVPKQPLVDEDDDEKGKVEGDDVASLGLSSGKKRKYPPSSGKKGPRNKKGMDVGLLESAARPLAKVAWFRVVLDEAQSIKNHRTQVARACWGLRAKRRWCLSGTPIQNAIDDLYSYFRFLRYEPYAIYNSFCSTIKTPIQKSPTKGYKKLQAVLKTIMLRRTKGTHIDGKPIINLPPKVVEMKKVDFTDEERDFYTRLESDSRAQFREYAAAGTVKQNYVNILLMLLRLRQACDHPLLVRGVDSNSFGRSSMEMAKKLPREKQTCLLNCLEASLAICSICNDPPEDAVVSICGHVFCNQCICEHLTGDDNLCPTSKCKVRLNASLVFSKAILNSCISDQLPAQDCSGSELAVAAPYSEGLPYDSSKIRAALEVLQSLNKPQDCRPTNGSLEKSFDENAACPENLCNPGNSVNENTDNRNVPMGENANGSVKFIGEKAIVFSQWTRMLDLLEACLKSSSVQYRRLDGTMSVAARDKAVKDFNTLPEVTVMIMSLKAASLGLNMVAACHVLLLDLWWNPTTEDQAIDRAHRIGQTRPVTVLRLTVKDTVEDRILALQQKKREMVASAFGEDETGGRQTRLTVDDLRYLFMV